MTRILRPWVAGLLILAAAFAAAPLPTDLPPDVVRDFEAERVEHEFTDTRAAAYRLVRSPSPRLAESQAKIKALLAVVLEDRALSHERRRDFLATLRYDYNNVGEIADERLGKPSSLRPRIDILHGHSSGGKRPSMFGKGAGIEWPPPCGGKSGTTSKDADPDKDFKEIVRRRSGVKMTAIEKAIMAGLDKHHEVDFERTPFHDVMGHLRKVADLPISVDKRALEWADQSHETPVTLTAKLSLRAILKKINGEMGLAYVIKDEAVLITSQGRARAMTVTRSYHFGDLAARMGSDPKAITSRAVLLEQAKMIVLTIQRAADPYSWKDNSPDAQGRITFDQLTYFFIIKQTAEFHFKNFGR